jgi:hypothetical protein
VNERTDSMRSPSTQEFYSGCSGPVIPEADSADPTSVSINRDLALGTRPSRITKIEVKAIIRQRFALAAYLSKETLLIGGRDLGPIEKSI